MAHLEIELSRTNSKLISLESKSATLQKTNKSIISFKITKNFIGAASVRFYVTGGKAQSEDWGFGKHFDGSGTWVNDGYENNYTVVDFSDGETTKTVTLTMVDNGSIEPNKSMSVYLAYPSKGSIGSRTSSITLVDDRVDYTINVLNPGSPCGHDLSAYALDNTGSTNNRTNLQAILDHFKNYHPNTNIIIYFPAGYYQFSRTTEDTLIKVPTNTNRVTFVGAKNPVTSWGQVNTEGTSYIFMPPGQPNWTRLFTNQSIGYIYGGTQTDYRMGIFNLVIDGKSDQYTLEQRHSRYSLEQQKLFMLNATNNTSYMIGVAESCYLLKNCSDGVMPHTNTEGRFYNLVGHNIFRGFIVCTAPRANMTVKRCYGDHPYYGYIYNPTYESSYDVSGVATEPNAAGEHDWVFEDCEFIGGKFQIFLYPDTDKTSVATLRRVRSIDPTMPNAFSQPEWPKAGNGTAIVNAYDCEFAAAPKITGYEDINFYTTKFDYHIKQDKVYFEPSDVDIVNDTITNIDTENIYIDPYIQFKTSGGTLPAPLSTSYSYVGKHINNNTIQVFTLGGEMIDLTSQGSGTNYIWYPYFYAQFVNRGASFRAKNAYLEDCEFSIDKGEGTEFQLQAYALTADYSQYYDTKVILVRPVFKDSLNGGSWPNYYTGDNTKQGERVIIDPISYVNDSTNNAVVYVHHRDSYGIPSKLTISGNNWQFLGTAKFMHFNITSNAYMMLLKADNFSIPQANNTVTASNLTYMRTVSFMSGDAKHPSSMTRGTSTTVACTSHGLSVNDKIMFDAIIDTEWKAALCPDTNVPLFQVTEVVDADTFRFNYDSSGLSADYDGSTDLYGVVYKPPVRLIIGESGDNPVTSKPAGFAGDLYQAGSSYYRCKTSGTSGNSEWEIY